MLICGACALPHGLFLTHGSAAGPRMAEEKAMTDPQDDKPAVGDEELDDLQGSGDGMGAGAEVCAAQIKEGLDNS